MWFSNTKNRWLSFDPPSKARLLVQPYKAPWKIGIVFTWLDGCKRPSVFHQNSLICWGESPWQQGIPWLGFLCSHYINDINHHNLGWFLWFCPDPRWQLASPEFDAESITTGHPWKGEAAERAEGTHQEREQIMDSNTSKTSWISSRIKIIKHHKKWKWVTW